MLLGKLEIVKDECRIASLENGCLCIAWKEEQLRQDSIGLEYCRRISTPSIGQTSGFAIELSIVEVRVG